jgi:DNA-binding transcriptional LysR family regulator
LTRLLAYQAADSVKRGRLRTVLERFESPRMPINIVYPTSRLLSAKVRAFIDLAIETADWSFG